MNIELYMLDKLKPRVQLARQIDVAQHKVKKEKHEKNWFKETADAMGIELDSDFADRYARPRPVCLPVFEMRRPPVMRKKIRPVRQNVSKRPPTQGSRTKNCS